MLLKTKDVAAILNCGQTYVLELARSGRLRALKLGSHWRYRSEDVEAFQRASVYEADASPQSPKKPAPSVPGLPLLESICQRRGVRL
jgi:excisionase family DNA binding protein